MLLTIARAVWSQLYQRVWLAGCVISIGLSACGDTDRINVTDEAGPAPFISLVHVQGHLDTTLLSSIEYSIAPQPGTVSKPVHVQYSRAALQARGYVMSNSSVTVPVFGLYAGYQNQVSLTLHMQDDRTIDLHTTIATAPYADPTNIYSRPKILTARLPGADVGFDFIYIKSGLGSPVVIDTDAQVRWAAPGIDNSLSSTFLGDQFFIGDQARPIVHRLGLDGSVTEGPLVPDDSIVDFQHNIETGKSGLLGQLDIFTDGVYHLESNIFEITADGSNAVLNHWDLGAIISTYMSSHGDDPTQFVRPAVDWFHSNSSMYDPRDDSVIISSRENFVIKLDYKTGNILWILGDPTKYWYTFPSLRAKALTLAAGGLYPIGQHALSITSDGLLMLFNDGNGSVNQPAGQPAGLTRTYSAVSAYSIDPGSMTAREVWNYDAGQSIYSAICSSAYQAPDRSLLIDYAFADNGTTAILVGSNSQHDTVFSFEYPTIACNTSWNAVPLPLDDLTIDR